MSSKIGRNETCPCGSGKKYKVCCGAAPDAESPQLLAWRRLSAVSRDYAPQMLRFIEESYGPTAFSEAWEEFTIWSDEPFDPESSSQLTLFYPWLFHVWRPLTNDTEVQARCLHSIPPTQAYLIARGKGVDRHLYRYLSACLDSPLGFFEVLQVDPGRGMKMREVLTEAEYSVMERGATETLRPGDIVYGMVVECDGIAMLEAVAPIAFPIGAKTLIVEQRETLLAEEAEEREALAAMMEAEHEADDGDEPVESDVDPASDNFDAATTLHKLALVRHDFSNRELYWELVLPMLNPAPPQLHNTDGHRLSLQRLIFAIDSASDAFAALKSLALGRSEEELLKTAVYASDGALQRVEIPWTKRGNSRSKSMESTLLGRVEIDGTQLAAEVNSAERAAEFKRLIGERLGERARYRVTEIQSAERLLSEAQARSPRGTPKEDSAHAELLAQPEVQARLRQMMSQHYAAWVDESIPALKGQTPREAVRTPAGREKVNALIQDIERMGSGVGGCDASVVADLRKTLGL